MPAINGLKIDIRRKKIMDVLNKDGQVRVSTLSENLGVSVVTIRNDLAVLEADGFLQRIQGGAIQTVKDFFHHDFFLRKQDKIEVKRQIAIAAAACIQDGETLLINSGSTTLMTAIELLKKNSLNIVTNSIPVAIEFGAHPSFRVILLGGDINTQYTFTYGKDAQYQLGKYKADKAILSIDGICLESGLTTYHAEEAAIDRLMMDRARETMVVADSSKFNFESFSHIADIDRVHTWVTDRGLEVSSCRQMEDRGIRVVLPE